MSRRILIVSPIPSEPRGQGNSVRIAVLGEVLQSSGYIIHFLYHKLEGLTPPQQEAMEACWDYFHVMPDSPRSPKQADGHPLALDDWHDPALAEFAQALHRRWHFAAVITNYVWCSAVLEAFDQSVLKILDTHDVFGGRDQHFRALGLEPAWYYTTPQEEARGLARADIILAIQPEEEKLLCALGHSDVRTLGHLLPLRRRPRRAGADVTPVFGYMASGNPLNLSTFAQLRRAVQERAECCAPASWVLAGTICIRMADATPFRIMGPVTTTDSFHDTVDVVLNPMPRGSGLKVKSAEAVHAGLPLVATKAAMSGLPGIHPAHQFAAAEEVVNYICTTRWTEAMIRDLQAASEACALEYHAEVRQQYQRLISDLD